MATYITRTDALALIAEERSTEILAKAAVRSVALSTFSTRNIGTQVWEYPVLETLPTAQWLADSDAGVKPTTTMSWNKKQVQVAEIASIAVIPENVLDDSQVNLESEIEDRISEAIGVAIDQAFFFGNVSAGTLPSVLPTDGIVGLATAAGHTVAGTDNFDVDFEAAMAQVEADGYAPDHAWAGAGVRSQLRTMRDGNGVPIYSPSVRAGSEPDTLWGVPISFVTNGAWDNTAATAIVGDSSHAVVLVRQDITAKRLEEATVGGINLAEQDMIGIRVKARYGFTVTAPVGLGQSGTPFPFSVVLPAVVGP